MLEKYEVNKQVPIGILEELEKGIGQRTFLTYNQDGITAYIVLQNISKDELKEYSSNLTVIYKDLAVPMLVLKYKKNSFEMPFFPNESLEISNRLDILFVDLNGYILKGYRRLGLDADIVENIANGINFVNTLTKEQIIGILNTQIYPKYTNEDMYKGGIRQVFRR